MRKQKLFIVALISFMFIMSLSLLSPIPQVKAIDIPTTQNLITDNFDFDSIAGELWNFAQYGGTSYSNYSISNGILTLSTQNTATSSNYVKIERELRNVETYQIEFQIMFNISGVVYPLIAVLGTYYNIFIKRSTTSNTWYWETLSESGTYISQGTFTLDNFVWYNIKMELSKKGYAKIHISFSNGTTFYEDETYDPTYTIVQENLKLLFYLKTYSSSALYYGKFKINYIKAPFKDYRIKVQTQYAIPKVTENYIEFKNTASTRNYAGYYKITTTKRLLHFGGWLYTEKVTLSNAFDIRLYVFDGSSWYTLAVIERGVDGGTGDNYISWDSDGSVIKSKDIGTSNYPVAMEVWQDKNGYWHIYWYEDSDSDGEFTLLDSFTHTGFTNVYAFRIESYAWCAVDRGDKAHFQYLTEWGENPQNTYRKFFKTEAGQKDFTPAEPPSEVPTEEDNVPALIKPLYDLFVPIYGFIVEVTDYGTQVIVGGITDWLNSNWDSIFKDIQSYVSTMANDIWSNFQGILNDIYDAIGDLPSNIYTQFDTILSDIKSGVNSIPSNVWSYFDDYIIFINNTVVGIQNTLDVVKNVNSFINNTLSTLNNTVENIRGVLISVQKLLNFMNGTITFLNNTVSFMSNIVSFMNTSVTMINATVSNIKTVIENIQNIITSINYTIQTLNQTVNSIKNLGNFINTTINNINSTLSLVKYFTSNINNLLNFINNTLTFSNQTLRNLYTLSQRISDIVDFINSTTYNIQGLVTSVRDFLASINITNLSLNASIVALQSGVWNWLNMTLYNTIGISLSMLLNASWNFFNRTILLMSYINTTTLSIIGDNVMTMINFGFTVMDVIIGFIRNPSQMMNWISYLLVFFSLIGSIAYYFYAFLDLLGVIFLIWYFEPLLFHFDLEAWLERNLYLLGIFIQIASFIMNVVEFIVNLITKLAGAIAMI